MVIEDPLRCIREGEAVIREQIHPTGKYHRVNLRIVGIEDDATLRKEIRQLRSVDIGKLVTVNGIVRRNTEVLPRLYRGAYRCDTCGELTYVMQERGKEKSPMRCSNDLESGIDHKKARFDLDKELSELIDFEKIEIQENPETLQGGTQPRHLTVILEDDVCGKIFPGDRVTITGTLVADQRFSGTIPLTEYNIVFYAFSFQKSKELEEVSISPEDEKQIVELSQDPNIVEKLSRSIAPTIFGMEMVKIALVMQMFGGVRKIMKDGTTMRGDIHILMVGDPGTAKSQLLKYMSELVPRGVFAFGRGSSAAGLTAAAVRDDFGEGRWTLEAGALVLADNGFVSIDELDKMPDTDTAAMHEAMEQQTVHVSKAGIMATLKSRCAVLGAANPKMGRYDQNRTIVEQIDFPPPLLSRFDVIFKIIDKPDRALDDRLAEHVLLAHRLGEKYMSRSEYDLEVVESEEEKRFDQIIDKEMVRKYVSYAKARVFPQLSDEALQYLREQYVATRNSSNDSIPITARQLESTIRLAEASAKAHLSPTVTIGDAQLAKRIVDEYLKDVSMTNGQVDIDILYSGTSSRQRNEMQLVLDIIRDITSSGNSYAEVEDVMLTATQKGLSQEEVLSVLAKLKSAGQIYEPHYHKLSLV